MYVLGSVISHICVSANSLHTCFGNKYFTVSSSGLPDFFVVQHTKTGKIYQITMKYLYKMAKNYTKWPQSRPYSHEIYKHLQLQDPPKFTQIWIFGLKICHLATLVFVWPFHWFVSGCVARFLLVFKSSSCLSVFCQSGKPLKKEKNGNLKSSAGNASQSENPNISQRRRHFAACPRANPFPSRVRRSEGSAEIARTPGGRDPVWMSMLKFFCQVVVGGIPSSLQCERTTITWRKYLNRDDPGVPDFSWYNIPKGGKNTKLPQNITDDKYIKWP
jgi:hypothetical protein